jgi:ribonuclease HI
VTKIETITRGEEWIKTGKCMTAYQQVIITLGRECREWGNGKADLEIKQLIEDNAGDDDAIVYTDGSVRRGVKSGWGFSARIRGRIVAEQSGAYMTTTSSMRMEVEAVTAAMRWLSETLVNRAVIVSDSQSMIRKVQNGWLRHEWKACIETSALQELVWIYCPGHAGVRGNERADVLASKAPVVGTLDMDRGDILKSIMDRLLEEDTALDESSVLRLHEYGIKRGTSREGREREDELGVCLTSVQQER